MPEDLNFKRDRFSEQDLLGYQSYIETLASMISAGTLDTPFTMGIYGKWGDGKTSFMRQLERELKHDRHAPHIITVWFNPWRYEKEEHLLIAFLKTIENAMLIYSEENKSVEWQTLQSLKKGSRKLSNASVAFAYGLYPESKLGHFGFQLDALKKNAKNDESVEKKRLEVEEIAGGLTSSYYNIIDEIAAAVDETVFRVVVMIDDLDRCRAEKSMELLESIKLFFDLPGYVFILGVNDEVMRGNIASRYSPAKALSGPPGAVCRQGGMSAVDYLDKMVQMPIALPLIDSNRKLDFIRKLLGSSSFGKYSQMIRDGVDDNPRAITRFVNSLAFFGRLAQARKKMILEGVEESPGRPKYYQNLARKYFTSFFYVKWAILIFAFPAEYQVVKDKTQHLSDLQDSARGNGEKGGSPTQTPTPAMAGRIQPPQRLSAVLAMGEPFADEPWLIRQFVELAAPLCATGCDAGLVELSEAFSFADQDMVGVRKGIFLQGWNASPCFLDHDYEIEVYPVSNGQYRRFIEAGGYEEQKYWSRAGAEWLARSQVTCPAYWDDERYNQPEQPVVGVSFFEAEAYAAWAGKRLPTGAEWERAARGDNGRLYPWGDVFDPQKCNAAGADNAPVNAHPAGRSPYGCFAMAGNVWQWTRQWRERGRVPAAVMVRGGRFSGSGVVAAARCFDGVTYPLGARENNIGFRCAG